MFFLLFLAIRHPIAGNLFSRIGILCELVLIIMFDTVHCGLLRPLFRFVGEEPQLARGGSSLRARDAYIGVLSSCFGDPYGKATCLIRLYPAV